MQFYLCQKHVYIIYCSTFPEGLQIKMAVTKLKGIFFHMSKVLYKKSKKNGINHPLRTPSNHNYHKAL